MPRLRPRVTPESGSRLRGRPRFSCVEARQQGLEICAHPRLGATICLAGLSTVHLVARIGRQTKEPDHRDHGHQADDNEGGRDHLGGKTPQTFVFDEVTSRGEHKEKALASMSQQLKRFVGASGTTYHGEVIAVRDGVIYGWIKSEKDPGAPVRCTSLPVLLTEGTLDLGNNGFTIGVASRGPTSLLRPAVEKIRLAIPGEDVTVANFVLDQLRGVVRGHENAVRPRVEDPTRLVFKSIEPFLVEGIGHVRPGQIRRASLLPVWQWLERDAPDAVRDFEAVVGASPEPSASEIERAIKKFQQAAATAIANVTSGNAGNRGSARIGPTHAVEDLPAIGAVLKTREQLDAFAGKLPSVLRSFGDAQIASVNS
eukprot:gene39085-52805_t